MKTYIISILFLILLSGCVSPKVDQHDSFVKAVVMIEARLLGNTISSGSGVILNSIQKGDHFNVAVLTAKHNTDGLPPGSQLVVLVEGSEYGCVQIYAHPSLDGAILIIEATEAIPGATIDSSDLCPLEGAYAIGFPMGFDLLVTEGILNYVIAKDLGQGHNTLWLCTAPIYPGNSGGGIFSRNSKKLIGLSVAVGSRPSRSGNVVVPHIHIFIPINLLTQWIGEVNDERQKR